MNFLLDTDTRSAHMRRPTKSKPQRTIESWVIDCLNPLKSENLLILADPQRMIRAGARAVDGWAKDQDDGVKVNDGKFGDLVAEVKALAGGQEED